MLGRIEVVLRRYGITRHDESRLLVAVSGGSDSVGLALAVVELYGARRIVLGHVNHGLRPSADADAQFVDQLAAQLNVPVLSRQVQPMNSSEAELRRVRYEALEDFRKSCNAQWLLTAHTRDDQAETVLMRLLTAKTWASLGGIYERRQHLLRPMLLISRHEVRAYLLSHAQSFCEDESNREPMYLRNRLRKELLPLIETRYRPGIARRLSSLARVARRIQPGRLTPQQSEAGVDRGRAEVSQRNKVTHAGAMTPGIMIQLYAWTPGVVPADGRQCAQFDAAALSAPRVCRLPAGARITPFGFEGRRRVRDLLSEAGIAPADRANYLVVVDDANQVIWVPGIVRGAQAPITKTTKYVWDLRILSDASCDTASARPL